MNSKHSNLGFAEFLLASEEDTTVFGRSAASIGRFDAELDDWILDGTARPGEQRAEAAAKIAACRDHNLTRLDLSRMGLTSLPACVGELYQLEWLVLVSNQLTTLPDWVCSLRGLVGLYASCNRIASLPESLGNLSRLERLRVDHNHLEGFPESLAQLGSLQQLSFGNNRIEKLPDSVWSLSALDSETLFSLPRMEQENRIAYLEHRAKNLSSMMHETDQVARDVISATTPHSHTLSHSPSPGEETAVPCQGMIGLLALQRVQLASEESAVRSEIDSLRIDLAVQNALLG